MTTFVNTYLCALCGRSKNPAELAQDTFSGFLLCKDSPDCQAEYTRQGKAHIAALVMEKEGLEIRRSELITLIAQARHEYGLPDPAQVEHDKWLAEIKAGDEQC